MQLKHLLVALVVLLALAGTAAAADSVEIRSTVLHYDDVIVAVPATAIDAKDWAGFYYDLDNDVSTEVMEIEAGTKSGTLLFTYTTTPTFQEYAYDGWFDSLVPADYYGYAVLGFFAEPYVALGTKNIIDGTPVAGIQAHKIAKLVIDDDTKYILKTGATLELGSGYSIIVDQIDVDGNKAYLKLFKDGKELNSSIVNTNNVAPNPLESATWIFDLTVLGEKNMQVMRVHVKDVFQGTESSLVEIDGLWMVDYQNAKEIKADDKFGKFECDVAGPAQLVFSADNVTVTADTDLEIGANIFMKTEKNFVVGGHVLSPDADKFYLYKVYTEPGTYDIRSSVFDYTAATFAFNFENFAAFFYDMDTGTDTENMSGAVTGTKILENDLIYTTEPKDIEYAYDGWTGDTFYIMGLFGEKFIPANIVDVNGHLADLKAEKMSKLVIDDDTKYILKTGATLELGDGYSIIVDQIDVDGNKAYVKFMKDGTEVNSSIINTNTSGDWILRSTVLNEKNTQIARIHVKDVFEGTQDSLVEIDGLWAMDYKNATELKSGDKFGVFDFDGFTGTVLEFSSNKDITLTQDMDMQIANNMYLKTADNATATNAYFYVAAVVDGNGPSQPEPQPPVEPPVTPPTEDPKPEDKPPVEPTPEPTPEKTFWQKYMWHIIIAIVLIIIIAGAAYYFLVMKKQ